LRATKGEKSHVYIDCNLLVEWRCIPTESLSDIDPARIFLVQLADAPVLQMDYLS
jgi:hypothetical protein